MFRGPAVCVTLLAAAAAVACSDGSRFETWPESPGAVTQIVAVTDESGNVLDLQAAPFGSPLKLDAPTSRSLRLELLTYDRSLTELDITEGVLRAEDGCARGCALLEPLDSLAARLDVKGELSQWQQASPGESTSEALVTDHQIRCDRCAPYDKLVVPFDRDVADHSTAFFASGDLWTYVGLDFGDLFRVNSNLEVERVCRAFASYPLQAAVHSEDDLWVMDSYELHRLVLSEQRPDEPCVVASSTAPADRESKLDTLTGSNGLADLEIYVIEDEGKLHRFDGSAWTSVGQFTLDSSSSVTLLWMAPGKVAVTMGDERVHIVENGSVQTVSVPWPGANIRAQALDPELGHILMLREGGVAFYRDDVWTLDTEPPADSLNVRTVAADFGGILYTQALGAFGRWYPETGFCPIQDGFASELVSFLGRVGPYVLFDDVSEGAGADPEVGAVTRPTSRCELR